MEIHQLTTDDAFHQVGSSKRGLTSASAAERRQRKKLTQAKSKAAQPWKLLVNQFRNPLVLLLLGAMCISLFLRDTMDAWIVLGVVLMSTMLGFHQEYRAASAIASLLAVIQAKVIIVRDDHEVDVSVEDVVEGDVVVLNAGDTIPGDGLLFESKDLFVDESALTGESFPAEKKVGLIPAKAKQSERSNSVYEGTHVVSGTGKAIILRTGSDTEFGYISQRLQMSAPETDFERGLRKFGEMLVRLTLALVIAIFAISVLLHRPALSAFTFALALAVGITPELLPAIMNITLARGALQLATAQVIVRRLSTIENLGSMTVLCSDKTGTLTEGKAALYMSLDADGNRCDAVKRYAVLNATFETGFTNPIDATLRSMTDVDLSGYEKFDEVPYDFIRKRLSVVVSHGGDNHLMITKGAFKKVLEVCSSVTSSNKTVPLTQRRDAVLQLYERLSGDGHRILGVAIRDVTGDPIIDKDDEHDMTFVGFLLFDDPLKRDAKDAIDELRQLGVGFKVITGDNRLVTQQLAKQLGIRTPTILSGGELLEMSDDALTNRVGDVDIFAETEPNQKERILIALRKRGDVVGYIGDGINDASALHVADVSISVDSAVDVAKEAADIVLLQNDLHVLAAGVRIGRTTFVNTLKYLFITTSANFGNMLSMAGASIFLPFFPLLPKQILLNNFLSDIPALAIATDAVDPEQIASPRRWDHAMIQRFMIVFGLVSSAFDFLTFGLLLWLMKASEAEFQTCWFVESLLTELFIIVLMRTKRPFFQSCPSRALLTSILIVFLMGIALPSLPFASMFGFVPLPWRYTLLLIGITTAYLAASELAKRLFFA